MLIDTMPTNLWPGQRSARPTDYPNEQATLRNDVARYLKGRFRISGERVFVIPPDQGIILLGGPFELLGPGQFASIHSEPAFHDWPVVRPIKNGTDDSNTSITVGVTLSGEKVYTAVTLHAIDRSSDELIGYFELEPLIPNPAKGL